MSIDTKACIKDENGNSWNAATVCDKGRVVFVTAGDSNNASDCEFALHQAIKRIRKLEAKLQRLGIDV